MWSTITTWLIANLWTVVVPGVGYLLLSFLNYVSKHADQFSPGFVKVCMIVLGFISFLPSRVTGKLFKVPFWPEASLPGADVAETPLEAPEPPIAPPKAPPAAGWLLLLAGASWLLSGCGPTLAGVSALNDATNQLTQTVMPGWDARCKAEAGACNLAGKAERDRCLAAKGETVACKAKGLEVARTCPKLTTCENEQDSYYLAVNTIHKGAAQFAMLYSVDKKDTFKAIWTTLQVAARQALAIAQKAGLFEASGGTLGNLGTLLGGI